MGDSEVTREVIGTCRICAGSCTLVLTRNEAGRIVGARGDRGNPLTQGYACVKGLNLHEAHYSPDRLLRPQKRQKDGSFVSLGLEEALDEIAASLRQIIDRHGPESVAAFKGTLSYLNVTAAHMLPAFLDAVGSTSLYSTMTIDQSAKWVTAERLGSWDAGKDSFAVSDVLMLVGANPLMSLSTFNFPMQNPTKAMRAARARGLRIVVIDPRVSETARQADVHLQPLPGEDPTILAGLIRIVISEGWHDADFCARWVNGFDHLRTAVEPFTPSYVAQRAGVSEDDLARAASAFAAPVHGRRPRGCAAAATGPSMALHSNLADHLIDCLNVICGRFARVGDPITNPGVVGARRSRRAQVIPPARGWEKGWRSRVASARGGYGMLRGEKMSATIPDEITTPGKDQIRALFVAGGNPVAALPDLRKAATAFQQLDLLVTIDPFMTATSRLSHYILPPRMMLERHEISSRDNEQWVRYQPYAMYAPPIIEPPPGADVVDDWYVFWAVAKRLGRTVTFDGVDLEMKNAPMADDLHAILMRNSPIPFDELKRYPGGKLFDVTPQVVEPAEADANGRFEVAPADVCAELNEVLAENFSGGRPDLGDDTFTHRLAVRRMREVQNTMFHGLPAIRERVPFNPAWMHPDDLADIGLVTGARVKITSRHGSIPAIVEADDTMRRGVVAMSHGWGMLPDDDSDYRTVGANTNLLVSGTVDMDPINAMPVMSGFPVRVEAA